MAAFCVAQTVAVWFSVCVCVCGRSACVCSCAHVPVWLGDEGVSAAFDHLSCPPQYHHAGLSTCWLPVARRATCRASSTLPPRSRGNGWHLACIGGRMNRPLTLLTPTAMVCRSLAYGSRSSFRPRPRRNSSSCGLPTMSCSSTGGFYLTPPTTTTTHTHT